MRDSVTLARRLAGEGRNEAALLALHHACDRFVREYLAQKSVPLPFRTNYDSALHHRQLWRVLRIWRPKASQTGHYKRV